MKKYDHQLELIAKDLHTMKDEIKMMKEAIYYLKTMADAIILDLKAHNMGDCFKK